MKVDEAIIQEYNDYINTKEFPCIAAKAAQARQQIKCMVADHLACPKDDDDILKFLYAFVEDYRNSKEFYHSAAVIFKYSVDMNEEVFDNLLWQRLQSLSNLDAQNVTYDNRVNNDPNSPQFSFSINQEAFYIIGLHAKSSRQSRQFKYATLVFNPHDQFEKLRETTKYDKMKHVVRKRDIALSGSINPMLKDFGNVSEVYQYSGREYDENWKCPLQINHLNN